MYSESKLRSFSYQLSQYCIKVTSIVSLIQLTTVNYSLSSSLAYKSYLQYLTETFEIAWSRMVKQCLNQITHSISEDTESESSFLLGHVNKEFAQEQRKSSQILCITLHQTLALFMDLFTPGIIINQFINRSTAVVNINLTE